MTVSLEGRVNADFMSPLTQAALATVRPVDDEEAAWAREAALAALSERVDGVNPVVHSVGLRIEKTGRARVPERRFAVLVSDRRLRTVRELVVDQDGSVTVPDCPSCQPPFTDDEIAEARLSPNPLLGCGQE